MGMSCSATSRPREAEALQQARKRLGSKHVIESTATIQADFDRIALVSTDQWNHNIHYHNFLLTAIPHCQDALEIGCGTGTFSRRLASRADHVLAVDLSPQMIRIAQERSQPSAQIDFQVADILTRELPSEHFDCVATLATLHHLPLAGILQKISRALKVGGTLVALDLFKAAGYSDMLTSAIALPVDLALRVIRNGRLRESQAARAAWAEHGRHEHYLTLAQVRQICAGTLPGARVRKHSFWRYSLIWKKERA